MKTTNEIKDEVAKSHGYDSWSDVHLACVCDEMSLWSFKDLENEAMEAYAQQFREGEKKGVSEKLPSCITCSHYEKFAGQIKGSCKKIHYSAPQCDMEGNRISVWNDSFGERVRVPDNYGCVLHKSNDH